MLHKFIVLTGIALFSLSTHAYVYEIIERPHLAYENRSSTSDPIGGAIGGGISNDAVDWVQADDFSVTSTTNITGGGIWIESQSGPLNWDGNLHYWFFSDNLGTPGAILETGTATTRIQRDTGILAQGGVDNIQEIIFDLSSTFLALSGVDYFFGIQLGNNNTAWSGYEPGNSMESFAGTFDNWQSNGRERSFYLEGLTGETTTSSIPSPPPLLLIITGLMSIYFSIAVRRISQDNF